MIQKGKLAVVYLLCFIGAEIGALLLHLQNIFSLGEMIIVQGTILIVFNFLLWELRE